jgi:hypothetical protein
MDRIKTTFPDGVDTASSTTHGFVDESIHEVYKTLQAFVLVFIVVLVSTELQATIVPMIAVPVSLIARRRHGAARLAEQLCRSGSSQAIGIVVDDAIVVVENVELVRQGLRRDATEGHGRDHRVRDRDHAGLDLGPRPTAFIAGWRPVLSSSRSAGRTQPGYATAEAGRRLPDQPRRRAHPEAARPWRCARRGP